MSVESKKAKALELAITQIDRQFGKGSIMRLGDNYTPTMENIISTGCLSLDVALGVGGIPRGRVVEIFGPESSGKTTLTLQVIAQAQKEGKTCAFVDAEHALDPVYAQKLGVNIVHLEIIILSILARNPDRMDHRLPRPQDQKVFGTYKQNMELRSLTGQAAWMNQALMLISPTSFALTNRPKHPMDMVFMGK